MRTALLGLIALAALISFAPSLGKVLGIELTTASESAPPLSEVETGFCKDSGIAVVVDFGAESGRETQVRCVDSQGATGWELLEMATQQVMGTAQYPIGFVCRIDDWPSSKEQDCKDTPRPAEGTWAYYFATPEAGDNWMFSGQGSASRKPGCGSVEGWRFVSPAETGTNLMPRLDPQTLSCRK